MVLLAHCIVCGSGDVVCLSFLLVGAGCRLTVIGGIVVVFSIAGRSHLFVRHSFVGCWPLFAGRCPLFCVYQVLGWLASFSAADVVCGGVAGMTWHAGDMEGTPHLVDAGDVGVWLSGLLVSWLSCFVGDVGGGGYLWEGWWNSALVVEVVEG